jgi:hypothetical protein
LRPCKTAADAERLMKAERTRGLFAAPDSRIELAMNIGATEAVETV